MPEFGLKGQFQALLSTDAWVQIPLLAQKVVTLRRERSLAYHGGQPSYYKKQIKNWIDV